jgi:hypothetical protein
MSLKGTWNKVGNLPLEQSLLVGGGGSLALFEVFSYAQSFLQKNMNQVFDTLWPTPLNTVSSVANLLKTKILDTNCPLIAREGSVGGMLLSRSGIFYLRGRDLILCQAPNMYESDDENNDFITNAVCRLSPHAFLLYHEAADVHNGLANNFLIKQSLKKHFDELLDDCLLHMLLNDFLLILPMISSIHNKPIVDLVLDLIKKVTLSKEVEEPSIYSRFNKAVWSYWPFSNNNGGENVIEHSSSKKCLSEWANDNRLNISNYLIPFFKKFNNTHIFYRDPNAWRQNEVENQEPWVKSFNLTNCMWKKDTANFIHTEMQICETEEVEDDGSWSQIGKLRYTITELK